MKTVSMSGSLRENVGKKDAKMHRKKGEVPCVLYGGKEQVHFSIPEKNFKPIIFTPEVSQVSLDISGKKYPAILQDVQYHPVHDNILHADFLEIVPGKPITVSIPVKLEGAPVGVLKGGKLTKKLKKLKLVGLVEHIPEHILLQIGDLDIGDSIRVRDIKLDNLTLLDVPNSVVVNVLVTRAAVEEEKAAGTAGAAGTPGA